MNDELKKKLFLRHGLCWGGAVMLCPVVMVVLDLFDKHTPNNIAMFTAALMMFLFVLSNAMLSSSVDEAIKNEVTAGEVNQ